MINYYFYCLLFSCQEEIAKCLGSGISLQRILDLDVLSAKVLGKVALVRSGHGILQGLDNRLPGVDHGVLLGSLGKVLDFEGLGLLQHDGVEYVSHEGEVDDQRPEDGIEDGSAHPHVPNDLLTDVVKCQKDSAFLFGERETTAIKLKTLVVKSGQ